MFVISLYVSSCRFRFYLPVCSHVPRLFPKKSDLYTVTSQWKYPDKDKRPNSYEYVCVCLSVCMCELNAQKEEQRRAPFSRPAFPPGCWRTVFHNQRQDFNTHACTQFCTADFEGYFHWLLKPNPKLRWTATNSIFFALYYNKGGFS